MSRGEDSSLAVTSARRLGGVPWTAADLLGTLGPSTPSSAISLHPPGELGLLSPSSEAGRRAQPQTRPGQSCFKARERESTSANLAKTGRLCPSLRDGARAGPPPPGPPPQSPRLPAPSPSSHRLLCFPPRPDQRARLLRLLVPGHGQLWTVSDHCLPCASERPRPGQRALPQPGPAPRPDAGVARLPARVAGSPGPRCGVHGRSPALLRDPVRFSSRPHVAPQVGADRSPSTGPGASANSQGGRGGGRSSAQGEWRPRGGRTRGSLPPNFRCS